MTYLESLIAYPLVHCTIYFGWKIINVMLEWVQLYGFCKMLCTGCWQGKGKLVSWSRWFTINSLPFCKVQVSCLLVGTCDLRSLWSPPDSLNQERHTHRCWLEAWGTPTGPVRIAQAGLARPSCHVHPCLARWTHRSAPNCITHPHWMYKKAVAPHPAPCSGCPGRNSRMSVTNTQTDRHHIYFNI
jgi:hypothetical protein